MSWTTDEQEEYERSGITPEDLSCEAISVDRSYEMDCIEADYMNGWHDHIDGYDANTAW